MTFIGYLGYNMNRMGRKSSKTLAPFKIARSDRRSLVCQVVDGIKMAIATRKYVPGDIIPSTRDLAAMLGVSRIVTRAAVRRLADEGYINPRAGLGCVVLEQNGKLWRGNVLFVTPGDKGDFFLNAFAGELGAQLVKHGWRFVRVATPGDDVSLLDLETAHPVDLAVVMFGNRTAERFLSKAGVPFVSVGKPKAAKLEGCVASVPFVREAAAEAVVARAAEAGVKSAWQVGFEPQPDLIGAFAAAKIPLKEILVRPKKGTLQPEATVFASQTYFEKLLAKGRSALPDLVYFSDDYVCQGALLALARHGVEAPRDVKALSWSNRGNGPYYFRPLARVELAPQELAAELFAALVPFLTDRRPVEPLSFGTTFAPGETF